MLICSFFLGFSVGEALPPTSFDFNRNVKNLKKKKKRTKSEDLERTCRLSSVEDRLHFSERRRKTPGFFFLICDAKELKRAAGSLSSARSMSGISKS